MDKTTLTMFFIGFVIIIVLNGLMTFRLYKEWIIRDTLLKIFPAWNKKNVLAWFWLWNIIFSLNIGIYILIPIVLKYSASVFLSFFVAILPYKLFIWIVYEITKKIVKVKWKNG